MNIIIEGVDRVGKSILAKKLADRLKYVIFHDEYSDWVKVLPNMKIATPRELKLAQEISNVRLEVLLQIAASSNNIIFDRLHLTEQTYGALRGLDFSSYDSIDKRLSGLDPLLILVESEDIKESSEQHGSSLEVHEAILKSLFYASTINRKVKVKYADFDRLVRHIYG